MPTIWLGESSLSPLVTSIPAFSLNGDNIWVYGFIYCILGSVTLDSTGGRILPGVFAVLPYFDFSCKAQFIKIVSDSPANP